MAIRHVCNIDIHGLPYQPRHLVITSKARPECLAPDGGMGAALYVTFNVTVAIAHVG